MNVSQKAKFSTTFPTMNKDFFQLRKFQPKTLETSMRHLSENSKSGRILANSENSWSNLNFTENLWGVPPSSIVRSPYPVSYTFNRSAAFGGHEWHDPRPLLMVFRPLHILVEALMGSKRLEP